MNVEEPQPLKVFSIDIGLYHLGMVLATLNQDGTIDEIHDCDLIDITIGCSTIGCQLHHEKNIADYMSHFFANYHESLEEADVILVEQQPPGGFISIQELIRFQFRDKTITVNPRSVHCHFDIGYLDYEKRKKASELIANSALCGFKNYSFQERKHDISDAYCQLRYWSVLKQREYFERKSKEEYERDFGGIIKDLEMFRFNCDDL